MNCKQIVIDYLKANRFDGLCNPEIPCGCLIDDLAPCGFGMGCLAYCQPGHKETVDEYAVCYCESQGTKHWHVCIKESRYKSFEEHFEDAVNWLCECGERCSPTSEKWRWNGQQWEHHHGYPIGHVVTERVEVKS